MYQYSLLIYESQFNIYTVNVKHVVSSWNKAY
jgi:hypothetical protein